MRDRCCSLAGGILDIWFAGIVGGEQGFSLAARLAKTIFGQVTRTTHFAAAVALKGLEFLSAVGTMYMFSQCAAIGWGSVANFVFSLLLFSMAMLRMYTGLKSIWARQAYAESRSTAGMMSRLVGGEVVWDRDGVSFVVEARNVHLRNGVWIPSYMSDYSDAMIAKELAIQRAMSMNDRLHMYAQIRNAGGINQPIAIRNWDGLREFKPMERTFNAGMAAFVANQIQALIGIGFLFATVAQMV